MSEALRQVLRPLDLSSQEEAIFLLLASRGSLPASSVARLTGIKRTTCYSFLERMVSVGVLQRFVRKGILVFDAVNTKKIAHLLDQRLGVVRDALTQLEENAEEIRAVYTAHTPTTRVTLFEGYEDITKAYDRILDAEGETIYAMTRKQATKGHTLEAYWKQFLARRLKKGKKMCAMINDYPESQEYLEKSASILREAKILPEALIPLWGDLQICGDVVTFVSQNEGRIWGISIQDEHIAAMFRGMHQALWAQGKSHRFNKKKSS